MLQKFVFRLFLAAFGFLLVPTNYWHACEKPHNEHSEDQAHIDTQHNSCSICDFELFQLDTPQYAFFHVGKQSIPSLYITAVEECQSATHSYFNKGPPATAF